MKHTEFKVVFVNGDEDVFYSFSVMGVFCAATFYMDNKGRDSRIKYIQDAERGVVYSDFKFDYEIKK